MTLKQLRDMIVLQAEREFVSVPPNMYPLIDQYINTALEEFCNDANYLRGSKSVSSVSSVTEYTLPSDVKEVVKVFYASNPIDEMSFMDIDFMPTASANVGWV
jgi:hypothetical protein